MIERVNFWQDFGEQFQFPTSWGGATGLLAALIFGALVWWLLTTCYRRMSRSRSLEKLLRWASAALAALGIVCVPYTIVSGAFPGHLDVAVSDYFLSFHNFTRLITQILVFLVCAAIYGAFWVPGFRAPFWLRAVSLLLPIAMLFFVVHVIITLGWEYLPISAHWFLVSIMLGGLVSMVALAGWLVVHPPNTGKQSLE